VDREARRSEETAPPAAAFEKLRKEKRSRRHQLAAMAAIGVASAAATTLLLRRPPPPELPPAPAPLASVAAVEASSVVEEFAIEAPVANALDDAPPVEVAPVVTGVPEAAEAADAEEPPPSSESQAIVEAEPPARARELPQLVLQGTSVLAGKPVAVVSDQRVFVGDFIEGALVLRIEERLVELELDGRRFTLTF
jgi:hypothetical protein